MERPANAHSIQVDITWPPDRATPDPGSEVRIYQARHSYISRNASPKLIIPAVKSEAEEDTVTCARP
jgi:hypothetical protein